MQPRILHRDDRLVGKGAHQLDLPLGERLDPLPCQTNRADHGSLAQQRHPKYGSSPGRHNLWPREFGVTENVRDMHALPSSAARPMTLSRPGTIVRWRKAAQCSGSVALYELDTSR